MSVVDRRAAGALLVVGGAVLWGTTGTAQELGAGAIPGGVPPSVVGAARIAVGGAGLVLAAALTRALPSVRPGTLPGREARSRRSVVVSLAAGAIAVAVYQLSFFAGVARAGVALGTLVALGSGPVLTGALGYLVRRERPDPRWPRATALAVAGCALLLLPGGAGVADAGGLALSLCAGAAFASATVAMKGALDAGLPSTGVMAVMFGGGALLLSPLLLTADLAWAATPAGAAMALYLGLAATMLAYVLFSRGLRLVPSSSAATMALAEPLTAALLGVALLGERPRPAEWLGAALVAAGLVALTVRARRT